MKNVSGTAGEHRNEFVILIVVYLTESDMFYVLLRWLLFRRERTCTLSDKLVSLLRYVAIDFSLLHLVGPGVAIIGPERYPPLHPDTSTGGSVSSMKAFRRLNERRSSWLLCRLASRRGPIARMVIRGQRPWVVRGVW